MEELQEALVLQDPDGRIVSVNAAARRVGLGWEQLVGLTAPGDGCSVVDRGGAPIQPGALPSQVARADRQPVRDVLGFQAPGRDRVWFSVSSIPLDTGGTLSGFVDVTELIHAQARLERRALYDPLTGIANRALILERLAHALGRQQALGTHVAVAFVDVDHLKTVNDTLGHEAGDELLRAVASRLRSALRPTDVVGRLGGDEFVVVMEQIETVAQAVDVVARLQQSVQRRVVVGGEQRVPQVSIGLRVAQAYGDPAAVLREADAALYAAKAAGRSRWHLFEEPAPRPDGRPA